MHFFPSFMILFAMFTSSSRRTAADGSYEDKRAERYSPENPSTY